MSSSLFREEAIQALQQRHLGEVWVHAGGNWLIPAVTLLACLFILCWLLGSTEYARRIPVTGTLDENNAHTLIAGDLCRVMRLRAGEGDQVAAGSVLIELHRLRNENSSVRLRRETDLQREKWLKLISTRQPRFDAEVHRVDQAIVSSRQLIALARDDVQLQTGKLRQQHRHLARIQSLRQEGFISDLEWVRFSTALLAERQRLNEARASLARLEKQLADQQSARIELASHHQQEIIDAELRLSELRSLAVREEPEVQLRAPVSGSISRLNVKTGDTVKPGDVLAHIDSQDRRITGTLNIPSHAAGHLSPGDVIWLELDAWPGLNHGRVSATVLHVTAHRVNKDSFSARLRISRPADDRVVLLPGMGFSTHITLDRRRLIDWLLSPLLEIMNADSP